LLGEAPGGLGLSGAVPGAPQGDLLAVASGAALGAALGAASQEVDPEAVMHC